MISLSLGSGAAEVVLNAPHKLNSLDDQALGELSRAYDDAAAAAYPGGLVEPLLKKMAAFPAPIFAAAQGACRGVGLGMHRTLDMIYTADLMSGTEAGAQDYSTRLCRRVPRLPAKTGTGLPWRDRASTMIGCLNISNM